MKYYLWMLLPLCMREIAYMILFPKLQKVFLFLLLLAAAYEQLMIFKIYYVAELIKYLSIQQQSKILNSFTKLLEEFGSSTIVVAIEAIKNSKGEYHAFIDNGREFTGIEVCEWAKKIEDLGCGEIIITSVDREGTGKGFDIELCQLVMDSVSIPVIAHGGAGKKEDVFEILENNIVDSISIASILHYETINQINNDNHNAIEGNFDFINSGRKIKNLNPILLSQLKQYLKLNSINSR